MKFISSKLHVRICPLIYISKGKQYLRQSCCSFSFSVPCVREIEKVKSEKVKTKPMNRNVTCLGNCSASVEFLDDEKLGLPDKVIPYDLYY